MRQNMETFGCFDAMFCAEKMQWYRSPSLPLELHLRVKGIRGGGGGA